MVKLTCSLCDARRPAKNMLILPAYASEPEDVVCGEGLEFACLNRQEKPAPGGYEWRTLAVPNVWHRDANGDAFRAADYAHHAAQRQAAWGQYEIREVPPSPSCKGGAP